MVNGSFADAQIGAEPAPEALSESTERLGGASLRAMTTATPPTGICFSASTCSVRLVAPRSLSE